MVDDNCENLWLMIIYVFVFGDNCENLWLMIKNEILCLMIKNEILLMTIDKICIDIK